MLGPVVDIELVDPPDRTPPGVVFGIKHFLTVPNSPEVREALEEEANSHSHYIIKMTEKNGKHEMEVIDSTTSITSQYFVTEKLEGRSLCKLMATWMPWGGQTYECTHSSPKYVVVTQKVGRCPHRKNSLYVWCYCPGSLKEFEEEMKFGEHKRTPAFTKVDIGINQKYIYNIKLRLQEGAEWDPPRQISHVEMCRSNGVKQFDGGTLKGSFGCSCGKDTHHCMDDELIFFEIEKECGGQQVLMRTHDALVSCTGNGAFGGAKTQEQLDRKAVMEAIVKPSDPGKHLSRRDSYQSIPISEFPENLAYDVQKEFGDSFKIWLGENKNLNKGTESRVKYDLLLYNSKLPRHANGWICGRLTWEKMPTSTTSLPPWRSARILKIVLHF